MRLFSFILATFLILATQAWAADYHTITNGSNKTITEHSQCKKVTNTIGATLFVPTKTSTEWSNFRSNAGAVSGISLANCSTGCSFTNFGGGDSLCLVPALSSGQSGGDCLFMGSCSATCNNAVLTLNSNFCFNECGGKLCL